MSAIALQLRKWDGVGPIVVRWRAASESGMWAMLETRGFEEMAFTSRDGLVLYARRYGQSGNGTPPVLCLAGLTRNSRDFHDLATYLSGSAGGYHLVYALDSRGRGGSAYDRNWKNYAVPIEAGDALDFIAANGLHGALIVGTSRGGLLAMVMAALQPAAIGAVVLNDIGPAIEHAGLRRIAGYVGRLPLPPSWEAATEAIARYGRVAFPAVPETQWAEVARQWFNEADGRPAPAYDPRLANTLDVNVPPPTLWPQFGALSRVPVLVMRGALSDLLSDATVAEMQRRHPRCEALVVPGQGHAPLLKDSDSMAAVARFLAGAASPGLAPG